MAKRISELDATSTLATGDELLVLQTGASKRGAISTTPDAGKVVAWPASASDFVESLTTPLDAADPLTSGDELLVMQAGVPLRGAISTTPDAGKVMAWPDAPSGTFTMSLAFGGASTGITYTKQSAYYTKIGNVVNWCAYLVLSSKGTATGSATLTGLPYTIQDAPYQNSPAASRIFGISFVGQYAVTHIPGSKSLSIAQTSEAGTTSDITDAAFGNGAGICVSGFYITSE